MKPSIRNINGLLENIFLTHRRQILSLTTIISLLVAMTSCNNTKFVRNGQYLLTENTVISTDPRVSTAGLADYVRQKPNTKWFTVANVPLGIYSLSGSDTTKAVNRRLRKWGQAPVILDTSMVTLSGENIHTVVKNRGYLNSSVEGEIITKGKRAKVKYVVTPGQQYTLHSVKYEIADKNIDTLLHTSGLLYRKEALHAGTPFSINQLYNERNVVTNWLNNQGYYYFNKENITFLADSSEVDRTVDITMRIGLYRRSSRDSLTNHPRYKIRNVVYQPVPGQQLKLRESVLLNHSMLESGNYYSNADVQKTYNNFSRLKAVRSTNIHLTEVQDSTLSTLDSTLSTPQLDATVQVMRRKPNTIQIQPEGTNTAGDFGAALSVTYENRNIFHGSETFSVTARGAYEAIRGLEGYDNSNYEELSLEAKLTFPKFMLPWLSRDFRRNHEASTELPVSYNIQDRPEFQRRVLATSWRYKWNAEDHHIGYTWDFLSLNFISMPWISDTFRKDYLESTTNRNAILRYLYEDLFIMKMGFGFTYTDGSNTLRTSVETAGNVLSGVASIFNLEENDLGQRKVANVAFAQYAKVDMDYTHLLHLGPTTSLALHSRIGVGIPYGNSNMLPYEKRYFAGGANSVRGWNVRTLGPGRFISKDGRIDFINQMGDIKIDLNAELRSKLFWKFQGALFIDAGNVWTIRKYDDQQDGEFKLRSLWQEMALAYGVGLRLNFDYFILRLDLGLKAINPAYFTNDEHFPILHMNFKNDYALHFAVGLPF